MKKKPNDEIVFGNPVNFDITKWNLNTLDLSEENHEALALVRDIYSKSGFFTEFKIDNDIFIGFLWQCHYFYTRFRNPFHNFFHAVTVTHAGAYFLSQIPRFGNMLDSYQKLAFITSCLGHDLDHRGKNNPYEINSRSELAIRYFDKSPLENHHAATLFKILNNAETNIFSAITADKQIHYTHLPKNYAGL